MRFVLLARAALAALFILSSQSLAYEAEKELWFKGTGTQILSIISTTDIELFQPLIAEFQTRRPGLTIRYVQASSANVFEAVSNLEGPFDLAISSAMDLQTKAANDGFARQYSSAVTNSFPPWSRWRNQVFGFTQEPAVLVASKSTFEGLPIPRSRPELIEVLRNNPERFVGRIATYDARISGLGYLFATQDAHQSDGYWRLMEVMGVLEPKLFCCSSSMIEAIENGDVLLAYNVLGSYANTRIKMNDDVVIIPLADYTNVMMRSVLVPSNSENPVAAGAFIDFLLGPVGRRILEADVGLKALVPEENPTDYNFRPIRLGPGLLVYLDRLKRLRFLEEWQNSLRQN